MDIKIDNNKISRDEINEVKRKIAMNKALKDFNETVNNNNYSEYEREQKLLGTIFNFKNIIYDDSI